MALVKVVRDTPEVAGGGTTALIESDAIAQAIENGWKLADEKKSETQKSELKTETVTEVKADEKSEQKKTKKTL